MVPGQVRAAALRPTKARVTDSEAIASRGFVVHHQVGDGKAMDSGTVPGPVATVGH